MSKPESLESIDLTALSSSLLTAIFYSFIFGDKLDLMSAFNLRELKRFISSGFSGMTFESVIVVV
jgi:hypothetical protein